MVKKSGAATGLLMYDEAGHLVGEYSSIGTVTQETIWLGDIPIAMIRPNGSAYDIFYMHTDQINTPRIISRPSDNKLRWRWDQTSPWGAGAATENPASLGTFTYNLRFPGQIITSETGNKQNGFRDYESFTGRYLQSDPIGLNGGINTYSYAIGNPVSNIDPLGLESGAALRSIMNAEGFMSPGPGPKPVVSAQVKAYLCSLIEQCKGNLQCVWKHTDDDRKNIGWYSPMYREAENWAYAAGWDWLGTSELAISFYQFTKLFPTPRSTTPYSISALLAGQEGRLHQNASPTALNQWCSGCGNK